MSCLFDFFQGCFLSYSERKYGAASCRLFSEQMYLLLRLLATIFSARMRRTNRGEYTIFSARVRRLIVFRKRIRPEKRQSSESTDVRDSLYNLEMWAKWFLVTYRNSETLLNIEFSWSGEYCLLSEKPFFTSAKNGSNCVHSERLWILRMRCFIIHHIITAWSLLFSVAQFFFKVFIRPDMVESAT